MEDKADETNLYKSAFFTNLDHIQQAVSALSEAKQGEFQTCAAKITSADSVENPDVAKYMAAMEDIVNQNYECLRPLYDQSADEGAIYAGAGEYCGPGTAEIAEDNTTEDEKGIRCKETLCCGFSTPAADADGVVLNDEDMPVMDYQIFTCQDPATTTKLPTLGVQGLEVLEWEWTCLVKNAVSLTAGLSLMAIIGAFI